MRLRSFRSLAQTLLLLSAGPLFAGISLNDPAAPVSVTTEIPGWGTATNPDGDCKFVQTTSELSVSVPGSEKAHDLAAEIDRVNAPRVLQPVSGDFSVQVKVEGSFSPGGESTQENRTGYNGAGLVLVADENNVVTLARAVLQRRNGKPQAYANFEMRSEGQLQSMGLVSDGPLPKEGPVWLKMERRGSKISGAVSTDGTTWKELEAKTLPESWPQELKVGVVAISTSKEEFNPHFSELKLEK